MLHPAGVPRPLGLGTGAGAYLHSRFRPQLTPIFHRLTYRRGMIRTARFTPDYQGVLYGALWDGDNCTVYSVRPPNVESAPLPLPAATPLAISSTGEVAMALGNHLRGIMTYGTLARVPLVGGAPRELQESVKFADWSPDGSELAIIRSAGGHDRLEFPIGKVLVDSAKSGGSGASGLSFLRVSPDGQQVAFFELDNGLAGTVAVVDRAGVKTTLTPAFRNLFGLVWNGDEIWFSASEDRYLLRDTILAVSTSGKLREVTRMVGNISLHDIAPDGRVLMAHTDDRAGLAVHIRDDSGERDLSWLDAPDLADISDDGQTILFSEWGVGGGPKGSAYLRRMDGSPAIRIGDGNALALSPDARWALLRPDGPSRIDLVPTGAGESRTFERAGYNFIAARWLPDGQQIVCDAQEQDRPRRLYVLDINSGNLQSITPEAAAESWAVAPDGIRVAASFNGKVTYYPVSGGTSQQGPGLAENERLRGWINDGLLVSDDAGGLELIKLHILDPDSGERTFWREIMPLDPTGLMHHGRSFSVTPDGQSYGYNWHRALSNLYVVEGLS